MRLSLIAMCHPLKAIESAVLRKGSELHLIILAPMIDHVEP